MERFVRAMFVFLIVLNAIATHNNGVSAADAEPECLKMTAALKKDNRLFFFYGPRYISFNSVTRKERFNGLAKHFFQNLPQPFPIDAAFTQASSPNRIVLISKDKYIEYSSYGTRRSGVKPLSNLFPRSRTFSQGIDAAVSFNGQEFFFKGCTLVVKRKTGKPRVYNLKKLRLPCGINAAWVNGHRIVISKDKFAWLMFGTKRLNTKPLCFADSFETSVNICKCR